MYIRTQQQTHYSILTLFIVAMLLITPLLPIVAEEGDTPPPEETTEETTETTENTDPPTEEETPPADETPAEEDPGPGDTGNEGTDGENAEGGQEGDTPGDEGTEGDEGTNPDATEDTNGDDGEGSDDGENGTATSTDPVGDTEIDTGEVDGDINIENDANNTEIDNATSTDDGTNATSTDPVSETNDETSTTTDDGTNNNASTTCDVCDNDPQPNIEVENDNDAEVDNQGTINGGSGTNTANNNDNVDINTGDINLLANVINFINTNIIGSGWNFVLDIADDFTGDLDLSQLTSTSLGGDITIDNNNVATVDNNFTINGNSGDNTANNNDGTVNINTGDVNISTNVINVVNSNLVNTQFMVTVINIWNNWAGDIVLPSQRLDVTYSQVPSNVIVEDVHNDNDATVNNDVDIDGSSGDNDARTIHNAQVDTGDVVIDTQIVNQVNTNLINQQYFNTTVNIFGEWFGYITGLHDLAEYSENDYQVRIALANDDDPLPTDSEAYLSITNSNDATVNNEIDIDANSGGNTATDNAGDVHISTGDVTALANIFNLINTNIVGGQFVIALVNVFGEWTGDLAYGRPDLKIEEHLTYDDSDPLLPGEIVDVTFRYENNGDSQATDIKIVDQFGEDFYVYDRNGGIEIGDDMIEFYVPELEPGETGEVKYQLAVAYNIPFGGSETSNYASIGSYEKDRNYDDNITTGKVSITRIHPYTPVALAGTFIGVPNYNKDNVASFSPAFTIEKKHDAETGTIFAGDSVSYQIKMKNTGSADAPVAIVIDDLYDPIGENINSQGWDLGRVYANEEIIFDYTIQIQEHAYNGLYTNYAQVYYVDQQNNPLGSERVSVTLEVIGGVDIPTFSTEADEDIPEQVNPIVNVTPETVSVQRIQEDPQGEVGEAFTLVAPAHAADVEVLGATIDRKTVNLVRNLFLLILLIFALAYLVIYYIDRDEKQKSEY